MHSGRRGRLGLLAVAALWQLGAAPAVGSVAQPEPTPATTAPASRSIRNVLLIHLVPRSAPALIALEQTFMSTLKATLPEPIAFDSEYLELAMVDRKERFEGELVAYLAAKYAHAKIDLVAVEGSEALRFAVRHRARLFPGVPIVFNSVIRAAAADVPVDADVSGVWLSIDWVGTLAVARQLQTRIEQVVVVTGASATDRSFAAAARAQLSNLASPIPITYLEGLPVETVLERVAALPERSVVLLGAFLADATGRRFFAPEITGLVSAASAVPVYAVSETHLGFGVVGGHLLSYRQQGQRGAEVAAQVLRGQRPPPVDGDVPAYRFDARQLRRWGLDAGRLPPDSLVEFRETTMWQDYRGYIVAGALLLAVQTWLIITLLASRALRRRAQQQLAGQLRFETLISDLLASQLTRPAGELDALIQRALALIGSDLEVDRIALADRDAAQQRIEITHAWRREDVPPTPTPIGWRGFPWMADRLSAGRVIVVSPLRPLPAEAATDAQALRGAGVRSLLAVPLMVEDRVVGVLSCATVRSAREWPDVLIDRLRLMASVFASTLARRRAEAAARESDERARQHRQELTHALRVNTLGELGASLAHEINQPLSAILINARVTSALLERGPDGRATMGEALADIAADAKRAADIIARLRALARKEHVPERDLSLDTLVDEVVALLRQDFVRRGIAIQRVATLGLPPVSGDRIQLQQIFLNVLVNASEALEKTERDGRAITITTSSVAADRVAVAVSDTGIGPADVDMERMFQRFFSTKPGGVGMGLAISRSIVEAHGGRIYARANATGGLTVHVELPAQI